MAWETDFTKGIIFDEENMFEGEEPVAVQTFDIYGNEIDVDEMEE